MLTELKPCPFCGKHPERNEFAAWCSYGHPLVQMSHETWNHRAASAAPAEGRDSLTDDEAALLNRIKHFHTHDFGRGPELHSDAISDAYKRGRAAALATAPTMGENDVIENAAPYLATREPCDIFQFRADELLAFIQSIGAAPTMSEAERDVLAGAAPPDATTSTAEQARADRDLLLFGESFMVDGKRVSPERVRLQRAPSVKAAAASSTTSEAAKFSRVVGPVSTHRTHPNQACVTLGFGSEELCDEFMKALNRLFTDNRAAAKGGSDE